jgi:hypothetical protein
MKVSLAWGFLLLASVTLIAGCASPTYTVRIEASGDVSWAGYYQVAYRAGPGEGTGGHMMDGSGDWQRVLPQKGEVTGIRVHLTKTCYEGHLAVLILRDGETLVREETEDAFGVITCVLGTPPPEEPPGP